MCRPLLASCVLLVLPVGAVPVVRRKTSVSISPDGVPAKPGVILNEETQGAISHSEAKHWDVVVNASSKKFEPASLHIAVGDTVTWTLLGVGLHSVKAEGGEFPLQFLTAAGQHFSHTFNTVKVVNYFCTFHKDSHGMTGTIDVASGQAPAPVPPTMAPPTSAPTSRRPEPEPEPTPPPPTLAPATPAPPTPINAPALPHLSLQDVMTCKKGAVSKTTSLCGSQYAEIVSRISALMVEFGQETCTNNVCHAADFAGCVLRAAGHDLMDFRNNGKSGTWGGSDGCLRFDDPDNKGLINCVMGDMDFDGDPDTFNKTLHDVYEEFCDVVSLADFIVIAGEAIMGFTETSQTVNLKSDFQASFMYGRTTRASCAENGDLPNPAHGCQANVDTFISTSALNLSWRQTAALMGVHSLGKAHPANSGYSGWWTDEDNTALFNNNYFISIVNKGWGPSTTAFGTKKPQWIRLGTQADNPRNAHPEMMLNTDMCLVYKDVKAESSDCCTWERFDRLQQLNITDTHNGEPIYCGFLHPFPGFIPERRWCCGEGANDPKTDCAVPTGLDQSITPDGPAVDDVHQFAANQDMWLGEFKSVWKLVTEKGASSLKPLEVCQATPAPPIPVTPAPPTLAPATPAPPAPVTPAPPTPACAITVYEHWPEGISEHMLAKASLELQIGIKSWNGNFPTGHSESFVGIGSHTLASTSGKVSSVKVTGSGGACCQAKGYKDAHCTDPDVLMVPIKSTDVHEVVLGAGVVAPGRNLESNWGCHDCTMCVKLERC